MNELELIEADLPGLDCGFAALHPAVRWPKMSCGALQVRTTVSLNIKKASKPNPGYS